MPKDHKKEEVNEILKWILDNRHNEEAMNDIAYTAYPHTTKYKNLNGLRNVGSNDDDDDVVVSSTF